ncbi:ABC-F family ATP-binding cassette domain-containing protein [Cetobacterium sp. SF1]|uniref:ABC-F family ATP-binding cassette domain-containing protein n=1 Tax=unclassified Cetobacterium TaxID=2630983 RepID=UPI003CEEF33D
MNIIEFKNVSKSFFTQTLYKNVDLEINSMEKIALVGHNGVGKSTFINMIMGEERPSSGKISFGEDVTISCFEQFGKVDMEKTVDELLDLPFEKVITAQRELEALSAMFTDESVDYDKLMEDYGVANDKFESLGGYSYMHIKEEFIEIFEFKDKLERKFSELSGGERQYIRLAISLFNPADLVILDEPLSFFDKKKTKWLSNYINDTNKAFLVISHNVDFIRTFANKIFDIDNKRIYTYVCDYNSFGREKKVRLAEEKKQSLEVEENINTKESAIQKKLVLLERCDNKHAQAVIIRRMKRELHQLNKSKIEFSGEYKYEYVAPPKELFIGTREIEPEIVTLVDVSKEYSGKVLYKNVNLEILKDSKICIVGENGAGKSTLLKVITGQEEPTTGKVVINKKAKIAYLVQETYFENENMYIKDYLHEKTGLSDEFVEAAIDSLYNNEPEFRDKRIFMLSGGEKKRLEIFTTILSDTDLLIIDEPSTYMDDYSRETIANLLTDYPGAVILVSHDKALMRKLDFVTYDIRDKMFRVKESGNN